MDSTVAYVIVGASLAGGRAVETLRADGFDGHIVLIGAEPDRPYKRPPLSKQYLRREWLREQAFLRPVDYYTKHRIDLRLGRRVCRVETTAKRVALDDGTHVPYDKLLIATGASPRRLHVPGADLDGVTYLRTLHDADRLSNALQRRPRLLVVGTGFLGCEVAATARLLGCQVTMLGVASAVLSHTLGEQIGRIYAGYHRDQGVDLRLDEGIAAFRGAGRLEEALTTSGVVIPCDLAVVGIGVTPVTDLVAGTGIAVDRNGIMTDEMCRTSVPDVYAAGDVAHWWHPTWRERVRIEHYDNADKQGGAAARSMMGQGAPFAPVPYFWSDQYDLGLEYAGYAYHWDEIIVRGRPAQRSFSAFYVRAGRVRACLSVNRSKELQAAWRLIRAAPSVDMRRLTDEGHDLETLVPANVV